MPAVSPKSGGCSESRDRTCARPCAAWTRYIATIETAKHRVFQFLPMSILPDNKLACIALDDAYTLGRAVEPLPCAMGHRQRRQAGDGRRSRLREVALLRSLSHSPPTFPSRSRTKSAPRPKRSMPCASACWRKPRGPDPHQALQRAAKPCARAVALTEAERDIHDRGLVTLIRQHHDAIDALVAEAYGWPADLSDEEILTRLVALNKERAARKPRA
jgi:hypothetical protein